jgi:RNA polymerase sigma-70 factor (ECF subfamily)
VKPNDQPFDTEDMLVARIQAGDRAAFEQVFVANAQRLYDYAFRFLRSRDEAEDVVQDLFVRLWQNREQLQLHDTLTNYLYGAVRNGVSNRIRHEHVVQRFAETSASLQAETRQFSPTPDEALEIAERQALISRAIATLPERRRMVCVLRWMQGLSYAEIAKRLGLSEKTVSNHLQLALRDVHERLQQAHFNNEL